MACAWHARGEQVQILGKTEGFSEVKTLHLPDKLTAKAGPLKHDDHWEDNPFFAQQKRVPFYGFFCFNFKDSRAATIE